MKFLGYFNLLGVLALAVLCVFQWEVNRRLNLEHVSLDMTRQVQAQKIAELEKTIAGDKADLNDFRKRLEQAEAAIKANEATIVKVTDERDQAAAQRDAVTIERDRAMADRDALQADLQKWVDAVKQRDAALKKEGEERLQAQKDRNDAVVKFNDLVGKYNDAVKALNAAQAKLAGK